MSRRRVAEPQVSSDELRARGLIDVHARYQQKLKTTHVFPLRDDRMCGCGCGRTLPSNRWRWASNECNWAAQRMMSVLHSHGPPIARILADRDGERCAHCGAEPEEPEWSDDWRERARQKREQLKLEADHIVEVVDGGGGRDLSNFQLLCRPCHVQKTTASRNARALARKQNLALELEAS